MEGKGGPITVYPLHKKQSKPLIQTRRKDVNLFSYIWKMPVLLLSFFFSFSNLFKVIRCTRTSRINRQGNMKRIAVAFHSGIYIFSLFIEILQYSLTFGRWVGWISVYYFKECLGIANDFTGKKHSGIHYISPLVSPPFYVSLCYILFKLFQGEYKRQHCRIFTIQWTQNTQ